MSLSRQNILEADDLKRRSVRVPEWGGEVYVRELTAMEAVVFDAWLYDNKDNKAEVVVYAAVGKAPERTGLLKKQIGAAVSKGRKTADYDYRARVGVRYRENDRKGMAEPTVWLFGSSRTIIKGGAYYWRFHEFGTQGGRGSHPGVNADRFLQDAFEENINQINRIFVRHASKVIQNAGK